MPNVELFTPYAKQKEFLDGFLASDKMFGVVVSPRGAGKTLLASNLILYWALDNPGQKCAWISPIFAQARNVFDELVKAARDIIETSNRMELNLNLINGSTIKFLSADSPDSIRGYRFNYLVIDEAAFVKELTIDQSILPTLNPNGKKALLISTPKSRNHFFKWYNKEDVYSMRFKLEDCPYINQEVIDSARKSLPPDIFKQEYQAEFIDSANDVFVGIDKVSHVEEYIEKGEAYIGIDTGLTDDMSVLCIMSPVGRVLNMVALNNKPINTIAETFINKLSRYNVIGGYIECNGIGKAMYDLVKPKFKKIKEFYTNQGNKQEMIRKLIGDIESSTVELPSDTLCPELHTEFSTYTYKINTNGKLSFTHLPGAHDDYLDALLMANFSRNQLVNRKPMTVSSIPRSNVKPQWGSPR